MTSESGISLVLKAAAFAADKHRMQRRKDAEASPYINHPLTLAYILCSEGGITDETTLSAALLHDTVEDTETTADELEHEFGPAIARIVAEVTDDKSLPKEERKRLQVVKASSKSDAAKLVKLADKISNLRDIIASPPKDWSLERREEYFTWASQVVAGIRDVSPRLEAVFDRTYSLGVESLCEQRENSSCEHPIPEELKARVIADIVSRVAEMGVDRPEGAEEALAILKRLPKIDPATELEIEWYASGGPPSGASFNLTATCLTLTVADEEGSRDVYCSEAGCEPSIDDDLGVWLSHFSALHCPDVAISVWN